MIKIGVAGATGKMGKLITDQILKDCNFQLVAATTSSKNPELGAAIIENVVLEDEPESLFLKSDLVIDFTVPFLSEVHIDHAVSYKKALMIGTTGLSPAQKQMLLQASAHIPVLYASNTSLGVAIMQKMVEQLGALLGTEFDIEISEIHHRHKVDAPSGTSLSLGESAARGREVTLEQVACYSRHGHVGPRPLGQIGFSVQRGGSIAGEHTVSFIGDEEGIEITHKGFSRTLFAKGALVAAKWLSQKPAGLYSMQDVLNLK